MASLSFVTAGLLYPIVILGPDPRMDVGWFAGFGLTNHRSRPVSAFPQVEEPPFPAAQVLQALT